MFEEQTTAFIEGTDWELDLGNQKNDGKQQPTKLGWVLKSFKMVTIVFHL